VDALFGLRFRLFALRLRSARALTAGFDARQPDPSWALFEVMIPQQTEEMLFIRIRVALGHYAVSRSRLSEQLRQFIDDMS
jgi:hypothetical protein